MSIKFSENEDLGQPVTLLVLLDQIPHLIKTYLIVLYIRDKKWNRNSNLIHRNT